MGDLRDFNKITKCGLATIGAYISIDLHMLITLPNYWQISVLFTPDTMGYEREPL